MMRQEIAKNAHAALRRGASRGEGRRVGGTFAHGAEHIEFNRRPQRGGALMGQQSVKDNAGIRRGIGSDRWLHGYPPQWESG